MTPRPPTRTGMKRSTISAGLMLFRRSTAGLEVFLAHPGGPFWVNRDAGAWTIPKGVADEGEDLLDAAQREFREETGLVPSPPFLPLGNIRQRAGKTVHAWAWEGDADPAKVQSNTMQHEWPTGSGIWLTVPEIDRCEWFSPRVAKRKINVAQAELIERLEGLLFKG